MPTIEGIDILKRFPLQSPASTGTAFIMLTATAEQRQGDGSDQSRGDSLYHETGLAQKRSRRNFKKLWSGSKNSSIAYAGATRTTLKLFPQSLSLQGAELGGDAFAGKAHQLVESAAR